MDTKNSKMHVEEAFNRVREGSSPVAKLSLAERVNFLANLQQVVLENREQLVYRVQQETHKSRSDILVSEVFGVLDNLAWLQKYAPKALADRKVHTPIALMGKSSWIYHEPLGTILVIAPWNYPLYQALVPIACAFTAGNTVIYKPSEHTPLEGLVEELLQKAEWKKNWVQVVYGDGKVGAQLINQRPDKIFFTGSERTGRRIMEQAAKHLIPVELELGGKDPMIVFDDVNLARAAAGAAWGALTASGQSCTSVERLYVQETIYDDFKEALLHEVNRIKQEVDKDGDADIGEMTTEFQVKVVARHIRDAKNKGATLLTGSDWDGKSSQIPPIVLEGITPEMLIATDETFGPVLPLYPFKTEEEVIARANDSAFGLSASVWSKDLTRAKRVARAIVTGNVSINNVMLTEGNPALPFGGVKNSGFGRYKGEYGLSAFSNIKSVLIDKDSDKIEANWYPYTKEKYQLFSEMMVNLFTRGVAAFARFAVAGTKLEGYAKKASKEGRK